MKKSELDRMMAKANELRDGASGGVDQQLELMAMLITLTGEQLLQMADIRRSLSEIVPKLDATASVVSDLEEKVSGKLAITRYDFGEKAQ